MSFAPPTDYSEEQVPELQPVPQVLTAEDAYLGRIRPSQANNSAEGVFDSLGNEQNIEPSWLPRPSISPPTLDESLHDSLDDSQRPSRTEIPTSVISRDPIRYNFPHAPPELLKSEAELEGTLYEDECGGQALSPEAPRSLRPGQKGFAERLMSKYGWTKGSGLGASGSGIVNPLRVQVEKQKKKPDSEGGGFVARGGKGKILGGKKGGSGEVAETGKFGTMSEVIILFGMVDGIDLDAELENAGDGGLMQEIGEECGEKV